MNGETVTISAADPLNLIGIIVPGDRLPAISGRFVTFCDGGPVDAAASTMVREAAAVSTPPLVEGLDYYIEDGLMVSPRTSCAIADTVANRVAEHCPYGFVKQNEPRIDRLTRFRFLHFSDACDR